MGRARLIDARARVAVDEREALAFISFQSADGKLIDGSRGVDSLLSGIPVDGALSALSERYAPLLALIAEHGGRWHPDRGFAVREEAIPDFVRAMRALPEAVAATEDETVQKLKFDGRPVQVVERIELTGDESMVAETTLETPEGSAILPSSVLSDAESAAVRPWVRMGDTYFRGPSLTGDEVRQISDTPRTQLYGDDVPFFLAKQLARLQRERQVLLGARASGAIVDSPGLAPVLLTRS